jgi:penicillin-binding protein 2
MDKRIFISVYIVIFIFVIFLLKLWYLQVIKGGEYKKVAEQNRLRTIQIPAPRGIIYDNKNNALVKNIPSFDISAVKEDLPRDPETLSALSNLLRLAPEDIEERLDRSPVNTLEPVKLKQDVSLKEAARVEARMIDFPGLQVDVVVSREYMYENINSHVMGYLGRLTFEQVKDSDYRDVPKKAFIGQMGIEKIFDKILRGVAGKKIVEVDAIGRKTRVVSLQQPVKGKDIKLTIDIKLQSEAANALKDKTGAIVALDPHTGEVLALASNPSFDPNLFSRGIHYRDWEKLITDPKKPILNRAIQSQYPPGSVFKIITALAALEEGIITDKTIITCTGAVFEGRLFRCWKKTGHGNVNLHRALVESCDVYFYEVGKKLGIDKIAEYASAFGLGMPTGIELNSEKHGIVPSTSWKRQIKNQRWYPGETLNTAIGQGYLSVTPLQAAQLMAAVVNGGIIYKPHILKNSDYRDYGKNRIRIKHKHLELVKKALLGVVSEEKGTGVMAHSEIVRIGGKTGTVQVVGGEKVTEDSVEKYRDHAWFIAFAPEEKPEIVVAVFVEHGGHGSTIAAPIAKKVIETFYKGRHS